MENRPILRIKLTTADWAVELTGWLLLVLHWSICCWGLLVLPSEVPVHFNLAGEVDGVGSSINLLLLPTVASVILVSLTFLGLFPHLFNYAVEITPKNAEGQYRFATRILRWTKAVMVATFFTLSLLTHFTALGRTDGLGIWFMPVSIAAFAAIIVVVVLRSLRRETR